MADPEEVSQRSNGVAKGSGSDNLARAIEIESFSVADGGETLYSLLRAFVAGVVSPDAGESPPPPLIRRLKTSFGKTAPRLREASQNSGRDLIRWTRKGSALRALLVISVGTITLLALTGLLVFMLFFLAATFNAIVISFLMSLAAAGGFLALFFACLSAIYIGALSVAFFIISATTISTIIAVIIATGWIGFFWMLWLAARKSVDLTKQSLSTTTSAITAFSAARHARRSANRHAWHGASSKASTD